FTAWPLLPVGYVISTVYFADWAWYSVMLGWLAKVLILRFGGAKLYQLSKPLFIGLIVGEALAGGAWLVINMVLASLHYDYQPAVREAHAHLPQPPHRGDPAGGVAGARDRCDAAPAEAHEVLERRPPVELLANPRLDVPPKLRGRRGGERLGLRVDQVRQDPM